MQIDPGDTPKNIALKQKIMQQWIAANKPKKGVRSGGGEAEE
jgi:hypothetical protein